jgi:F420-dependent oxidoreductase-like protein
MLEDVMQVGMLIGSGRPDLDELVGQVRQAAARGLDSVYFSQVTSWDALTVLAVAGREVPAIGLGTAVVATYPRHPVALAVQALSTQAATGGRLTLGVGPSHAALVESTYGCASDRPVRHVREYLTALGPLLRGEPVDFRGTTLAANARVDMVVPHPPSVLLAALGPAMLRIAGELADGTVTVWTGPADIADRIAPAVTTAAAQAGRPAPRIVASAIVSVTADPDGVRRQVAERFRGVSELPSYRAQLAREGLSGVHETVVAGDEDAVLAAVRRYADAGTTEFVGSPFGDAADRARTLEVLAAARRSS